MGRLGIPKKISDRHATPMGDVTSILKGNKAVYLPP